MPLYVQQRPLVGDVNRAFFGSNKRTWVLAYENLPVSEYEVLKAIHDAYLLNGSTVSWEVTGNNYSVSETTVHVDLPLRDFKNQGIDYLSNIEVTLIED